MSADVTKLLKAVRELIELDTRQIYTREEVANKYKLKMGTLDYLVSSGEIPYSRLGKRIIRFDSQKLDAWFEKQEGKAYHRPTGK